MISDIGSDPRFLRALLAGFVRANRKLRRLVETQRAEITLLAQRRTEFDLSADDVPAPPKVIDLTEWHSQEHP